MENKLQEGVDFYYADHGRMVFTMTYLLRRGYCCGGGCRHCPYNYENVPSIKKQLILEKRQQLDEKGEH